MILAQLRLSGSHNWVLSIGVDRTTQAPPFEIPLFSFHLDIAITPHSPPIYSPDFLFIDITVTDFIVFEISRKKFEILLNTGGWHYSFEKLRTP